MYTRAKSFRYKLVRLLQVEKVTGSQTDVSRVTTEASHVRHMINVHKNSSQLSQEHEMFDVFTEATYSQQLFCVFGICGERVKAVRLLVERSGTLVRFKTAVQKAAFFVHTSKIASVTSVCCFSLHLYSPALRLLVP